MDLSSVTEHVFIEYDFIGALSNVGFSALTENVSMWSLRLSRQGWNVKKVLLSILRAKNSSWIHRNFTWIPELGFRPVIFTITGRIGVADVFREII